MKKYIAFIFLVFIFMISFKTVCIAENSDTDQTVDIAPIIDESLDKIDLSPWQEFIEDNPFFSEISGNSLSIKELVQGLLNGKLSISFDSFVNLLFSNFTKAIKSHIGIASMLLGLAIISIISDKFGKSIFKGNISSICTTVIFCAAAILIIKSFSGIVSTGISCINRMSSFTEKALPILTVFLTAIGSTASSEMLQPSTIMIVHLTTQLINSVIIPLLTASAVLSASYRLCKKNIFSEMSSSVNKLNSWIIGLMFTLFFGFISIQKLTSSALDGASIKTIKYTISSFSLYGGSFLSKSFDIVTGCAVIMKSILGGIGMIILLSICISPALEICAASIIYRGLALILTALGESNICGCLNDVGKIYGTLFLAVMTVSILMFAVLSIISAAGNTLFV